MAEPRHRRGQKGPPRRSCLALWLLIPACAQDGALPDAGSEAFVEMAVLDDAAGCPPPTGLCNGMCVDLASDAENCGRCGATCGPGVRCVAGACDQLSCPGLLGLPGPPVVQALGREIAFGDLDLDGAPDLIGSDTGVLRTARNQRHAAFDSPREFSTWNMLDTLGQDVVVGPNFALGDWDGDGRPDVAQIQAQSGGWLLATFYGRLREAPLAA